MDVVSRLTAAVPPGGRRRTSNPGWPRGPLPVGASRRDLSTWLRPEKSQSIARGRGFESRHLQERLIADAPQALLEVFNPVLHSDPGFRVPKQWRLQRESLKAVTHPKLQVHRAVIVPDSVQMMKALVGAEVPAEELFHHQNVFEHDRSCGLVDDRGGAPSGCQHGVSSSHLSNGGSPALACPLRIQQAQQTSDFCCMTARGLVCPVAAAAVAHVVKGMRAEAERP